MKVLKRYYCLWVVTNWFGVTESDDEPTEFGRVISLCVHEHSEYVMKSMVRQYDGGSMAIILSVHVCTVCVQTVRLIEVFLMQDGDSFAFIHAVVVTYIVGCNVSASILPLNGTNFCGDGIFMVSVCNAVFATELTIFSS